MQAVYFKWLQPSAPEQGHAYVHLTAGEEPEDVLPHEEGNRQANEAAGPRGSGEGEAAQGQRVSFWEGFCR